MQVRWKPNDVLASLAQVLTNLAVDAPFAKVLLPVVVSVQHMSERMLTQNNFMLCAVCYVLFQML